MTPLLVIDFDCYRVLFDDHCSPEFLMFVFQKHYTERQVPRQAREIPPVSTLRSFVPPDLKRRLSGSHGRAIIFREVFWVDIRPLAHEHVYGLLSRNFQKVRPAHVLCGLKKSIGFFVWYYVQYQLGDRLLLYGSRSGL